MTEGPDLHRQAALRHEQAAEHHDRAAAFWDEQGKRKRAGLQRELAEYERHGAELEREWAGLINLDPADHAAGRTESAGSTTRKNAEHLSSELDRTAEALENTAAIAEQHARRREEAGMSDGAGEERRVADRASKYARRARTQAEQWRKLAMRAGPQ